MEIRFSVRVWKELNYPRTIKNHTVKLNYYQFKSYRYENFYGLLQRFS